MKKIFITLLFVTAFGLSSLFSQSVGFSYFFPKNGYFSNPVAPINLSLPVKFGNFFQVSPGIGFSNIGGMSMTGFPDAYNSDVALVGPFQSLELNLVPAIVLPFKTVKFYFEGGAFGFASFNCKLIADNFNQMLAQTNGFDFINTTTTIDKKPFGGGFLFGFKTSFKVTKSAWGYVGARYYMGGQKMALNGEYYGVKNTTITHGSFEFPNTSILYHGIQISIGAIIK